MGGQVCIYPWGRGQRAFAPVQQEGITPTCVLDGEVFVPGMKVSCPQGKARQGRGGVAAPGRKVRHLGAAGALQSSIFAPGPHWAPCCWGSGAWGNLGSDGGAYQNGESRAGVLWGHATC